MAKLSLIIFSCLLAFTTAAIQQRGLWCGTGWSASIVPDSAPMPSFSGTPLCDKTPTFGPSCEKHDKCYDQCGTTQKKCDDDFYAHLTAGCEAQKHTSKVCQVYCSSAAYLYFKAVSNFGTDAFKQAQIASKCK